MTRVAACVQKMSVNVKWIMHSSKTRAMQTAIIFADQLNPEKGVSESDSLAPMVDPVVWAKRIDEMEDDIILVGHLPYMAKLAGLLLCGHEEKTCINFTMGGIVCCRHFDDRRWAVEWMIVPEMIR